MDGLSKLNSVVTPRSTLLLDELDHRTGNVTRCQTEVWHRMAVNPSTRRAPTGVIAPVSLERR